MNKITITISRPGALSGAICLALLPLLTGKLAGQECKTQTVYLAIIREVKDFCLN